MNSDLPARLLARDETHLNFNLSSISIALLPREKRTWSSANSHCRGRYNTFLLLSNTTPTGHRSSSRLSPSFVFSCRATGCVRVFSPWFKSTIIPLFRQFLLAMAPDLPINHQKARPNVQPVLPELSRLFKARASKGKVESSSTQTSPSETDQSAAETKETTESANEAASTELPSDAGIEQEDLNNATSCEDKAVSASTGEHGRSVFHES